MSGFVPFLNPEAVKQVILERPFYFEAFMMQGIVHKLHAAQ